jgi:Tol biopolymer transport system component
MKIIDGKWTKPEIPAFASDFSDDVPFVSPDQSYIIFTSRGRPEGSGLFISYKKDDGNWTKAKYMGEPFGDDALLTTISPNGKYLFFTGRREGRKGVFWVDAKIIDE